jgi:hypothetical protein
MLEHEREQSVLPVSARHCVGEQQVSEGGAFEEKRAQGDGAADIGCDDAWSVEAPVFEQSGEAAPLSGDAEVLTLTLLGLAVAEMIEEEDASVRGQRRNDRAPDERRVGSAMDEHDRRSVADTRPAHLATVSVEPFVKSQHRHCSCRARPRPLRGSAAYLPSDGAPQANNRSRELLITQPRRRPRSACLALSIVVLLLFRRSRLRRRAWPLVGLSLTLLFLAAAGRGDARTGT